MRDDDDLLGVLRVANWELQAHSRRDPGLAGMATTLTGLVVAADGGILLAHSGDSRAYRMRDGALTRQTRDDSFVQELVEHGIIGEEEAQSHPRRNVVTASLSGREDDGIVVTAADAVAELALARGSHDNVTAVVCDVSPGEVGAREEPVFHGATAGRFSERLDDLL